MKPTYKEVWEKQEIVWFHENNVEVVEGIRQRGRPKRRWINGVRRYRIRVRWQMVEEEKRGEVGKDGKA